MAYVVVIAPDLGVSAEEFANAWNAESSRSATAHVFVEQGRAQFIDPSTIDAAVRLIGEIGVGVASGAIIELIKARFPEKAKSRKLQIIQAEAADGSTLLAVTVEDE